MADMVTKCPMCVNCPDNCPVEKPIPSTDFVEVVRCVEKPIPSTDIVEVVRCKDCYYYIKEKSFGKEYGYCDAIYQRLEGDLIGVTFQPDEDYFCAYGERKVRNDRT